MQSSQPVGIRKYIIYFLFLFLSGLLTVVDYFSNKSLSNYIPNQINSMKRDVLKNKLKLDGIKIQSKPSIQEAISSLPLKNDEIILITGSLYLAGEVLNLN